MTAPAMVSLATMTALMFGLLFSIELNTRPAVGPSQLPVCLATRVQPLVLPRTLS